MWFKIVMSLLYDVLALEFVENIDNVSYLIVFSFLYSSKANVPTLRAGGICSGKKGFLGQRLHTIAVPRELPRRSIFQIRNLLGSSQTSVRRAVLRSGSLVSNSRSNNFARLIYFLNALISENT
jgi:hypothetical protein